MDSLDIHRIKHVANVDVVRRLLIKYFCDKGFMESFDRQLYPSVMQDLPFVIPSLTNKIEIVPHAVEVDPTQGKAVLGWNMFVLGNHRMYLGETHHNNLNELARQISSGLITIPEGINAAATARRQSTPRRVITFITRVLESHETGYVNLMPSQMPFRQPGDTYAAKQTLSGMPQQFFTRSGYGV
jgi:hypothetical protein